MVLKVAVVPGQLVRLVNGVAPTLIITVNVALLVTLPQAPLTATLYVPASELVTNGTVKVLLVSPIRMKPSFDQSRLKGPVPEGVVLKVAVVPGQLVRLVKEVAVTLLRTVKVALLVTLPQAPLTVTL